MQRQVTRTLPRSFLSGGVALLLVCMLLVMTTQPGFAATRVSTRPLLPSAARPTLYIGDNNFLYGVFADVGSTRYHVPLDGSEGPKGPIGATPFVGFDKVYADTVGQPNFFACKPDSDEVIFSTTIGTGPLITTPVSSGNHLFFGDSGLFRAVREDNGAPFWSFSVDAGDRVDSAALVATIGGQTTVYFGTAVNNKVFALDPDNGSKRWSTQLPGSPQGAVSTPVADDRLGLVFFASNDHHVYALSASDGHVVWSFQAGGAVTAALRVSRGFVSQLDKIYFGGLDGTVYALNANTGALFWQVSDNLEHPQPIAASVAVNGPVYVVDVTGVVQALDAGRKGANLWTFTPPFSTDAHTGLLLANGLLYVAVTTSHGVVHNISIYALDPGTGAEDWRWDGFDGELPGFSDGRTLEPLPLLIA